MNSNSVSPPTAEASLPPAGEARRPTASYVLVVDDEAVVREFLGRCLELAGYSVQKASGAAEALDFMIADPATIVLCDIRMPGQDGLWLLERLRGRWPYVPVVMTTAIDDLDTVRQARDLGAADYINKPVKPGQLLEVVQRVIVASRERASLTDDPAAPPEELSAGYEGQDPSVEAEYTLETPLRCSGCGERIATLKAVRLVRAQVNFTSTLPRRGRVLACPHCLSVLPAELTNF